MGGSFWARSSVLLAVTLLVTSTLDAAVLQPRSPRAASGTTPVVFPRSAAAPQDSTSPWEAGSFAASVARAADKVAPNTGYGSEGDHELELDFGREFVDKFPEWKNRRLEAQTIIFPKMMSSQNS